MWTINNRKGRSRNVFYLYQRHMKWNEKQSTGVTSCRIRTTFPERFPQPGTLNFLHPVFYAHDTVREKGNRCPQGSAHWKVFFSSYHKSLFSSLPGRICLHPVFSARTLSPRFSHDHPSGRLPSHCYRSPISCLIFSVALSLPETIICIDLPV